MEYKEPTSKPQKTNKIQILNQETFNLKCIQRPIHNLFTFGTLPLP